MCRLLETIKIKNRTLYNIEYHNERLNRSRRELFQCTDFLDLKIALGSLSHLDPSLIKCRVLYKEEIEKIEYHDYTLPRISSLRLVQADNLDYSYKYKDRSALAELKAMGAGCDDILIVKQGRITDTSFCNIVFYDGSKWITPASPLLKGTKRAKLLKQKRIIEDIIYPSSLKHFKHAALINSMIDLEDRIIIAIKNIVL